MPSTQNRASRLWAALTAAAAALSAQPAAAQVVSVVQTSYDAAGRVECTAVRMNPAAFTTPPASACAMGTQGSFGPDRITRNTYDAAHQVLMVQRALGTNLQQAYATYGYTPNGRQDWVQDANGNRTDFTYDGFDRLTRMNFPLPAVGAQAHNPADYEAYGYDAGGNPTSVRIRSGETLLYQYDAANRLTLRDLPSGTAGDVHYGYDLLDRQLWARFSSTSGPGITFAYDGLGRLTSETRALTGLASTVTGFGYDAAGNRTSVTYAGGLVVNYAFDAANRVTTVRENGALSGPGVLATYAYDTMGRRLAIGRAGGAGSQTAFAYDGVSRLAGLSHDLASTGADVAWTFAYTPASQIGSRGLSNDAYAYDTLAASTAYARNGLNQYTAVGGVTVTHDARGNLTSDGTRTFAYDLENRLIQASGLGSTLALEYDPLGRLARTTSGTNVTNFVYDGDRLIAEYDGTGQMLRRYAHGPGVDEPLVQYEGLGLTDRRWLLTDHLGSVVTTATATASGGPILAYSAYGEPQNGDWSGPRFRFTGQLALPEARLYHFKARVYDPALGRFLQTDPIGYEDGLNLYAYVGNDPFNAVDPSGTECINGVDGMTRCVTAQYDVSFSTPEGFQNTNPQADDYHFYEVVGDSPLGAAETRQWVRNNPTPGDPQPATPGGTPNDATPLLGGAFGPGGISPVESFTATNLVSGREVVVNATLPGHPLGNGIVVRETVPDADGTSTIMNWGEGNGALQAPGSPFARSINDVWRGQVPPDASAVMRRFNFCSAHPGAC